MKKFIEFIRNLFHGYLGLSIAFFIFSHVYTVNFTWDGKYIGIPFFSAIAGLSINGLFNWFQGKLFNIDSPAIEYIFGGCFAIVGGLLAVLHPNALLSNWLFGIAVIVAVGDILRTKKQ
jgi:hypothetical protein